MVIAGPPAAKDVISFARDKRQKTHRQRSVDAY